MNIKQVAINAFIVIGTLALVFILWQFREALILFGFSLAIAAAARPYMETLINRGVPRSVAIILIYVLFLAILGIIFGVISSSMLLEIQHLSNNLANTYEQMWKSWPAGSNVQRFIINQLPPPAQLYESFSPEKASPVISSLFGITVVSANFIGQIVTIFILSIYWSIDRVHFERLWLSLLPVNSRARARDIWRNIERDFGAYVRSEILQSLFAGVLIGVGLWLMGVNYPILLAIFAALAWLIPWFGGVLAIIPIALTALSQHIWLGVFAAAFAMGVLFFLEFYVEPRFIRRRQRQFSSLLSILLIIALSQPYGLMGFIVAPPLAAAIELIFRYNLQAKPVPENTQTVEQIAVLRGRLIQIRQMLAHGSEPPEPYITSLLGRLEGLLKQTDQALWQARSEQKPRQPSGRLRA